GLQIADVQSAHVARVDTRWQLADSSVVDTQDALANGPPLLRNRELRHRLLQQRRRGRWFAPVEVARFVWARRHACAAADAGVLIDQHYPIVFLEGCRDGADLDARRVFAMHARTRREVCLSVRAVVAVSVVALLCGVE